MNVIITGATKGIGLAIAEAFAAEGANLMVNSRTETDLEALAKDFGERFPEATINYRATDMSKKVEVLEFAKMVTAEWEQIDVLVNNAGVFLPGQIHLEEEGTLELQIETNLYSAYNLTRALLPTMMKNNNGHVFNICSIASFMAYPNGGSYSISKWAMLGFSKVLREEMKDKGIRVTSVMPGATWSASWAGVDLPETRLMPASDIALAVLSCYKMGPSTVVEDIILRPQLGDL